MKNHKIIRSRDVAFNENELYKENSRSNASEIRKVVVEDTKDTEDDEIEGDAAKKDNTANNIAGDQDQEFDPQTPEL